MAQLGGAMEERFGLRLQVLASVLEGVEFLRDVGEKLEEFRVGFDVHDK